jgi:RNA polymerase sigma-70 factor (ECF subfamily)
VDADEALVAAAQAGDTDAVEALVRRYQTRIFNFALAMTGSAADADDLAQETFIRAFRGLHRFRGDSSFKNWLYRIAANAAATLRGSQQRRSPVWEARVEADDVAERHMAARGESAEWRAIRRQAIDRALAALPPDLRVAVVLRDVEGLDYKEIAAATGAPIGTVESRIFRARRRLRPLLQPLMGRSS